jgi:hypothetical protein
MTTENADVSERRVTELASAVRGVGGVGVRVPMNGEQTRLAHAEVAAAVQAATAVDDFDHPVHIVEAQFDDGATVSDTVTEDTPVTDISSAEQTEPEPWPYETIDYAGERLEVRKPSAQAMVAFTLAQGDDVSQVVQLRVFSMFVRKHLSPSSFERVISRMMEPDADGVSIESLVKTLVTLE